MAISLVLQSRINDFEQKEIMENRRYWSVEDTKALLSIWAEEHVQRQIDGVCQNEDVIKYIVAELRKLNIERTTVQVREKLKKLRAQYKSIKIHNSQSGAQRKNFPFFDIMDGVLGHRPSVSGETTRDTMPANITVDLPSQSMFLESENDEGPSTPPLCASTPERTNSTAVIRGGSHHIPPRTRTESHKRKANSASREFLQCMRELSQNQIEKERHIRCLDREAEMAMRREEMEFEARLRREEMHRKEKETAAFASIFENLAAAILQKK